MKNKEEKPISLQNGHIYQLIINSRNLQWLAIRNIFKNLNITKVVIDGVGNGDYIEKPVNIILKNNSFRIRLINQNKIRFGGHNFGIITGENINLKEVYESLQNYKPQTLFITEIEAKDDNLILSFKNKMILDRRIRTYLEKSKDTHSTPLFLQRIFDLETLMLIKKKYFYKKVAIIQKSFLEAEDVLQYEIINDD